MIGDNEDNAKAFDQLKMIGIFLLAKSNDHVMIIMKTFGQIQVSGDGPRFLTDSDTKTVTIAGGNGDDDDDNCGYNDDIES